MPRRRVDIWIEGRVAVELEKRMQLRATRIDPANTILAVEATDDELDELTGRLRAAGFQINAVVPAGADR